MHKNEKNENEMGNKKEITKKKGDRKDKREN